MSTRTSRFPPSDAAVAACTETIQQWAADHEITTVLDEPVHVLSSRVNSWIEPRSVFAGVEDVMGLYLNASPDKLKNAEIIKDLGERLAARLVKDDLFVATRRRGAGIG